MKKIITIVGARPQIIKASAISRVIKKNFNGILQEIIVHTGQHYDDNMSNVFFDELEIPKPNYNLAVGSGNHGMQTAKMIEGIEKICLKENPDCLLVYGDTNSTVAGGLAASKLHIPLVHIEAGIRSFNKLMPEEINRIMCDHASTLMFCPTEDGIKNLKNEGFDLNTKKPFSINNPKVYHCGDIMFDNSMYFSKISDYKSKIIAKLDLKNNKYILSTIHRDGNTDVPERLENIFKAILKISETNKIVLPLHPRTKKIIENQFNNKIYQEFLHHSNIKIIKPVGFLDIIALEKNASMIITDSGGLQKESFFFKKPCLILRPETEWKEIVANGNALIVDANYEKIYEGYQKLLNKSDYTFPNFYGDGKASEFICSQIFDLIN